MTGQVDARGRLLSVGAVKEKAEALVGVGVTTMVYPAACADVDLSAVQCGDGDAAATVEVRNGFFASRLRHGSGFRSASAGADGDVWMQARPCQDMYDVLAIAFGVEVPRPAALLGSSSGRWNWRDSHTKNRPVL